MMAEKRLSCGPGTARYKVVQGHFYPLVLNFEQVLTQLAAKLFEKSLINEVMLNRASNPNQPAFERASSLLKRILKNIERNQMVYDAFVLVLREISELKDIASELEVALRKEEDSTTASPIFPRRRLSKPGSRPTLSKPIGRRYSDSELVHRKEDAGSEESLEMDSGVTGDVGPSFYIGGDIVPEEAELDDTSTFEDEQPKLLCAEDPNPALVNHPGHAPTYSHNTTGSLSSTDDPEQQAQAPRSLTTTISTSSAESAFLTDAYVANYGQPIERTFSDGTVPSHLTPLVDLTGEEWNRKAENTYLKSENQQQAFQICDLKEVIDKLKEEKENSAEKLKQQGIKISQKDEEIKTLKKDCAEKDKHVGILMKDKAEMEKTIQELRDQCAEAERKQAKSEEEIKCIHEQYKGKLAKLEKNLEEVESREKQALIELANAKAQLAEANLAKEREVLKLREEYFKQEKIKFQLQLTMKNLEEEKKRDCLVREKEVALKEKELALKDRELALKEKELMIKEKDVISREKDLAEEKESRAKEETRQAKEETKQAKEDAKQAKEDAKQAREETEQANIRRKESEQRLEQITKELDDFKSKHDESHEQ